MAAAPQPPPRVGASPLVWVRENLFSSPFNAVLTLGALWLLWKAVPPLLDWAIFDATISGTDRTACAGTSGACWTFVKMRLGQFVYGLYPEGERWRVVQRDRTDRKGVQVLTFTAPKAKGTYTYRVVVEATGPYAESTSAAFQLRVRKP